MGTKPGVVEMVKKRKFKYFGHCVCEGGTAKAVMEGGMEGTCERGPQRNWMGNLKDGSGEGGVKLSRLAMDWDDWKKTVFNWVHPWPLQLRTSFLAQH